jgi:hypothetical protein
MTSYTLDAPPLPASTVSAGAAEMPDVPAAETNI